MDEPTTNRNDARLDEIINSVPYLPPAPANVPALLDLLHKPNVDSEEVVKLIAYDPGLTTNVMRLCNSAYFGGASPANDLHEAVLRLGFNEVYQLVVAIASARMLAQPQKGYGIDSGELWQHSIVAAQAATLLALEQGDDQNVVFTAALLHDVGKIVLAHSLEDAYGNLIKETEANQSALVEAERKLLGVQHTEIGGRLLARWKFSAELVAAVWFHHDPQMAKPYQKLASYVYLGNMIAYFMGFGYGHQAFAMRGREEALDILGLDVSALPHCMIKTFESLEGLQAIMNFKG